LKVQVMEMSTNQYEQSLSYLCEPGPSQSYSAFIYCAQLLTLEHCTQNYLQKKSEQTDCSLLTELSFFMNTFFHNTAVTALAEILSLRAYAIPNGYW